MGESKLMTPLFHDGNFNREGRRMRAVFEREITDGVTTFRLWRTAGKPDLGYPRAENDKYILHLEANGYLLPLGETEFSLADRCGFFRAVNNLYGGMEGREQYFDHLRKAENDAEIRAALEVERREIERFGSDPACQVEHILRDMENRIGAYLKSKANGGKTFPDFMGAAMINDLENCAALSAIYRAHRKEEDTARAAQAAEEERAFCKKQNNIAEQEISYALQVIRNGGVLQNETLKFYQSKYSCKTYSIVNYLMRQYGVDVPLRTQGWINDRLSSAAIKDGKCEKLRYLRSKKGRCSQKSFECMNDLIRAVTVQTGEKIA